MIAVLLVTTIVAVPGCSGRTLQQAVNDYASMTQAMNVDGIANDFLPSGVLSHVGAQSMKGPGAIRNFLSKFLDYKVQTDRMIIDTTIRINDGWMVEGSFEQAVKSPEGKLISATGHYRALWKCEPAGWRLRLLETS